ncbi:MAG: hypothetical protein AAB692_04050 [Patescibacteria group bacterium]
MKLTPLRLFVGVVIAAVAAAVAGGLYLAGSPNKERMRQFDAQRLSALQTISSAVDSYYDMNTRLPGSLAMLSAPGKPGYYLEQTVDPATKEPYEFSVVSDKTYEICANFDLPYDTINPSLYDPPMPVRPGMYAAVAQEWNWNHPAGRYCFSLNAQERTARAACSLTNPCAAGQTCAALPNRSGSVCVPAGMECLAAGCPGACAIAESYPVQVRCTP